MTTDPLQKLDEIEAEMRRIGYWSEALESGAGRCGPRFQSCLDAPSFAVWLQGLFLPNARAAAREGVLPARSQAGEIARRQYAASADLPETRRLHALLREFDELCLYRSRG
jgi:uncharacterized protein YqcC (DUF446 family)